MIVWLVGGVDPTGGAGVDRDEATLRTFSPRALGARLVTAHTEQGHGAPARATSVEASSLCAAARRLPVPAAIKVGLVPADVAAAVAEAIGAHDVPRVVDPVLAATDGGRMGARADALAPVLALATVITPNRPEAAQLTGSAADDPHLLEALLARWPHAWVLLKDGHGDDPRMVCDRLAHRHTRLELSRTRQRGPDPRGTGCALASAIAACLAHGSSVPDAVKRAVAWLDGIRGRAHKGVDGRFVLPDR